MDAGSPLGFRPWRYPMKTIALLACLLATPALAQTTPAPAPAPAAPAGAQKYTVDTPIETLAADPAAKKVIEDAIPGITTHESYDMFKSMSLAQLQPMAGGRVTEDMMTKVKTGLAAIK
jgi:hypothetical protein